MRKKIVSVLTVLVLMFTAACGTYSSNEVTPLDDNDPPQCVAVSVQTLDEWDNDVQSTDIQGRYCLPEEGK